MKKDIKKICEFLDSSFRKKFGTIEKVEDALNRIRQAKNILKTENGGVASFTNFAQLIQLDDFIARSI